MQFTKPGAPLQAVELPTPQPGRGQVRIRVAACGVCRTDLHIVDGDLEPPRLPLIPGHQIVGEVEACGDEAPETLLGRRVGVPWLAETCGHCRYCRTGRENLCDQARFTGFHRDGGFATHVVADARACHPLPEGFDDVHAAPLLCAGLIGYRALCMVGDGERVGLYGFGSAAHIVAQVARHQGRQVYAFTRPGDLEGQRAARALGAAWAGGSDETPPEPLDGAIIFAPAGHLVPAALAATAKGGTVVCGGIHMSDIPSFPYALLWGERQLRSVANLTRRDATEFLALAPQVPVRTQVQRYTLEEANQALDDLRDGCVEGAAVLVPE
ncbi:MAG: zinc-dependent alcohol dehydrogenase family protein [Trueperaceae bacterium]|nr:zinc-dependent alcohol dehydrogenase family protein [Trueperaceae bacterium]